MAKVNNTINKEENIMKTNYSKMLKAELLQVCKSLHKSNEEYLSYIEKLKNALTKEQETTRTLQTNIVKLRDQLSENKHKPVIITKPVEEKPEYANAAQCEEDKAAQDNISKHHDKYPTAKQVDFICNILATRKYPVDQMPQIHRLTKDTANKLIDFFKTVPVVYRDHTLAIKDLMTAQHMTWDEACHSIKLINGQKAYNKLVSKYGTLPTLTYAYKVEK